MQIRKSVLAASIALSATQAFAVPFSPFDARSLSMGGTGVANARPAAAGLFNPALLAAQGADTDFSVILPTVGVIIDDSDNVVDTVDEVQNGSLSRTEDAIEVVNASGGANPADVQALSAAANGLAADLPRLGNKPVNLELGAGFGFGVPSKKHGFSLHVASNLSAGIVANVSGGDVGLLTDLAGYAADGVFSPGERADTRFFDASGTQLKDLGDMIASSLSVVGVVIGEAGISLAREFTFGEQTLSIGVTPKILMVDTIHYRQVLNGDEELGDVVDDSRYRREYSDFNIDFGVAKVFGEDKQTTTVGLVVKNLITQSYQTAPDANGRSYAISIEPQVRAGVARRWGAFSVAGDLDLTRNQSVGLTEDSQFLSVGGEMDLRYFQFRLGYRHNLVSDGIQDMATAGLGLGPVDVSALYADEHSLGVNLQIGFTF